MTIPTSSDYPDALDTTTNLYLVHDSLRMKLAEDYEPGDKAIYVSGDPNMFLRFPATGQITLTEQCSDPALRALSFFYNNRSVASDGVTMIFTDVELLPHFIDCPKPKFITDVTMNVMADHHNNIKNAVIAIENFIGIQGTTDDKPFGPTLEGRINFLRKLVLVPRAWFAVNKNVGLVPLTVTFTNQSFRLASDGTDAPVTFEWNFGDNTGSTISIISVISAVPPNISNVEVFDIDGGPIDKTYNEPGIFDVTLTVTNKFGSDTVVMPAIVNSRIASPDLAVFEFAPYTGQIVTPGVPIGGPYITPPVIRAVTGGVIQAEIPPGVNPNTGRSFAGELLDGYNHPIDPVTHYTWAAGDDLTHANSPNTTASYSVGGIYDLILRVDTKFGAYRITKWPSAFDIIEEMNMWLWTIDPAQNIHSREYGLISETFKAKQGASFQIDFNSSFLSTTDRNAVQQHYEFTHNNGFTPRGSTLSGDGGSCLVFWASGRSASDPPTAETIEFLEYEGFSDIYTRRLTINRPWNWVPLASPNNIHFLMGGVTGPIAPNTSPTNQTMDTTDLITETNTNTPIYTSNYLNGATDLMQNPAQYDGSGLPLDGHMSVYRSAWKGTNGYFVRNDNVGDFFKLRSFYRTEPVGTVEAVNIRKLPDMAGLVKIEGRLVPLNSGLYFFNNSGAVSAYNDASGVWETNNTSLNSSSFRVLQDTSVIGYDNLANTLLATSDGDHKAYLSFDYSTSAFIKFSDVDTTFSALGARPDGTQWQMGIF